MSSQHCPWWPAFSVWSLGERRFAKWLKFWWLSISLAPTPYRAKIGTLGASTLLVLFLFLHSFVDLPGAAACFPWWLVPQAAVRIKVLCLGRYGDRHDRVEVTISEAVLLGAFLQGCHNSFSGLKRLREDGWCFELLAESRALFMLWFFLF